MIGAIIFKLYTYSSLAGPDRLGRRGIGRRWTVPMLHLKLKDVLVIVGSTNGEFSRAAVHDGESVDVAGGYIIVGADDSEICNYLRRVAVRRGGGSLYQKLPVATARAIGV